MAALAARPADAPVVMVNLLQFRADGGRERNLRYAQDVVPHIQRVGATVSYAGAPPQQVIGEGERPWWDAILIVEYPSPAAFLDMVTDAEYLKVREHRAAALDRGDFIGKSSQHRCDEHQARIRQQSHAVAVRRGFAGS